MKLRSFIKGNRGSAMLTVVIAILFIAALGIALLSASYLGFAVTMTQKGDKANFYTAETAMDQLRAGVHSTASDALAIAYTTTLKEYPAKKAAQGDKYDEQATFSTNYVTALKSAFSNNGTNYSSKTLRSYIAAPDGSTVTVNGCSLTSQDSFGTISTSGTALTLKNIQLVCTAKGYEARISTDITIKTPSFQFSASIPHSLKEFSVVANTSLDTNISGTEKIDTNISGTEKIDTNISGTEKIDGSVYAGAVKVNGGILDMTGGDLCSPGDVKISNGAKFNFGGTEAHITPYDLWANGIILSGDNNSLTIGGTETENGKYPTNTYIANDLSVTGSNCSVKLDGTYTGFGGDTASTTNRNKDKSSSILIGGSNTSLDLSGLSKLTLAGVSFIDPTPKANTSGIPMGQSVAVKTDQLAYLVPTTCLGNGYPTNPYYYGTATKPVLLVYTDTPLWPNCGNSAYNSKLVTDYLGEPLNVKNDEDSVKFQYGNVEARYSSSGVAYVFFVFNDQSRANAFFKDYCAANPTNITQYLSNYVSGGKLSVQNVSAAGQTYNYDGSSLTQKDGTTGSLGEGPKALYESKKVSPYASIVKKEPAQFMEFKDSSGKIVAILTNDNFTYNQDTSNKYKDLKLIVSTADVTISENFQGIIVSKGTVTATAGISPPQNLDWDALEQSIYNNDTNEVLSTYIGLGYKTASKASENNWDIDNLVVYENWKKS